METIKIKVKQFDTNTNSLIISVASNETQSNDPNDYDGFCYQPLTMWPDEANTQNLLRNLAYANLYVAKQQKQQESISESDPRIEWMKTIEGETFEFNVEDLINSFK